MILFSLLFFFITYQQSLIDQLELSVLKFDFPKVKSFFFDNLSNFNFEDPKFLQIYSEILFYNMLDSPEPQKELQKSILLTNHLINRYKNQKSLDLYNFYNYYNLNQYTNYGQIQLKSNQNLQHISIKTYKQNIPLIKQQQCSVKIQIYKKLFDEILSKDHQQIFYQKIQKYKDHTQREFQSVSDFDKLIIQNNLNEIVSAINDNQNFTLEQNLKLLDIILDKQPDNTNFICFKGKLMLDDFINEEQDQQNELNKDDIDNNSNKYTYHKYINNEKLQKIIEFLHSHYDNLCYSQLGQLYEQGKYIKQDVLLASMYQYKSIDFSILSLKSVLRKIYMDHQIISDINIFKYYLNQVQSQNESITNEINLYLFLIQNQLIFQHVDYQQNKYKYKSFDTSQLQCYQNLILFKDFIHNFIFKEEIRFIKKLENDFEKNRLNLFLIQLRMSYYKIQQADINSSILLQRLKFEEIDISNNNNDTNLFHSNILNHEILNSYKKYKLDYVLLQVQLNYSLIEDYQYMKIAQFSDIDIQEKLFNLCSKNNIVGNFCGMMNSIINEKQDELKKYVIQNKKIQQSLLFFNFYKLISVKNLKEIVQETYQFDFSYLEKEINIIIVLGLVIVLFYLIIERNKVKYTM